MKKSPYHQADGIASAAGKSLKHEAKKEMLSKSTGKSKEQIEYDLSRAKRGKEIKEHRENNPREGGTFNADAAIASTFPKAMKGGLAAKAFAKVPKQKAFMKTVSPLEQTGMVDPMLTNAQGMPVDPMRAVQPMQPINVGMPGSMPVPAGVGHNMQQPVQAGQRMLSPIAPMAMKGDLDKDGKMSSYEQARQTAIEKNMALQQNGKVKKVDAVTGSIQKSNEGPIVRTRGAGRANPHATFTAFDGSAIKLPSVQQQVDKYDKQTTEQKTKKRLSQAYKSTK